MAELTGRVEADSRPTPLRRAEPGPLTAPAGNDLLRLQQQAGNSAVAGLPGLSTPGAVQRRVHIGPPPKNAFAKKRAILGRLTATQPGRAAEIRQKVVEILEQGGVHDTEDIVDGLFDDIHPILEAAADVFSREQVDATFADWNEAIDSSLQLILPIATSRGLIGKLTARFAQSKSTAGVANGPALAFAEQRFAEALATAKREGLSFAEWTRALSWAQVQITELRHLNKPKPKAEEGGAWQQKKSKTAKQQETRAEVSITERVAEIDSYKGAPEGISDKFNQFVNAMEAQSVPTVPVIVSKYRTGGDRAKNQFSVEVRIPLLDNWVIHAHCVDATGETAAGKNAMHYKRLSDKYALGASITLTNRQEGMLLPPPTERRNHPVDPRY